MITPTRAQICFLYNSGKEEWTLIINKNWKQHLATEYDEKEDIVRVKVKPMKVEHTERLQYFVEVKQDRTGMIAVAWEKLSVAFSFELK
ncbi:MAG: DUF2911 domain-containing protein [Chitinophagaceae bacterium]